jgi:hypothetical protein
MMSFGSVAAGAMSTLRTGLVTTDPAGVLNSTRKPTWTLRSLRKLPPIELPDKRTGAGTGKKAPPRTSTFPVEGARTTIS